MFIVGSVFLHGDRTGWTTGLFPFLSSNEKLPRGLATIWAMGLYQSTEAHFCRTKFQGI